MDCATLVPGRYVAAERGLIVALKENALAFGEGDVALRGPASRLLLVLVRRLPPDDPQIQVLGDPALLTAWLAGTPF